MSISEEYFLGISFYLCNLFLSFISLHFRIQSWHMKKTTNIVQARPHHKVTLNPVKEVEQFLWHRRRLIGSNQNCLYFLQNMWDMHTHTHTHQYKVAFTLKKHLKMKINFHVFCNFSVVSSLLKNEK